MLALELIVLLGLSIILCARLGARIGIAPPILLLAAGVLLWFVPPMRSVHLPPETMLLLFLPALLYWEAITTSLRGIRRDLRGIILSSTVLVIVSAAAVAAVAHAFGLPWGPAWVLGAALAPTDATAVGVMGRILPRRDITVLRAESLVNDGTALVVYGVAVAITVGAEDFSAPHIGWLFLLAYAGGAIAGAAVAWLAVRIRRRLDDPVLINVAILVTPFAAFWLAEEVGASGVLAVVVAGLIISQIAPRMGRADARRMTETSWTLAAFVLNGSLFVLIGLEAQAAARNLTSVTVLTAVLLVVVVALVLVAVRVGFLFVSAYTIRLLDRRPEQRLRRVPNRARVVSGFAGFRGAVSLAAALAIPEKLSSGQGFPDRDAIIFVAAGVIAFTLVVQGALLPVVVRWARLPVDNAPEQERRFAETHATEVALDELPALAAELGTDPDVAERLRNDYDEHLQALATECEESSERAAQHEQQYTALRLALLARKRAVVVGLRDEHRIDDAVLLELQTAFDTEEVRLTRY
ncbi:Na+/H+ antiporter [Nocardia sp. NPDC050712]|uniref:Na+/H+ antiporter n=1 Tax=Nocardia sp. NPDC050712 TaxID=3155518 RepID=UPI0033FDC22D